MALIFSNENRILFNKDNRENVDQLLELSYGNLLASPLKAVNPQKRKSIKPKNTYSQINFGTVDDTCLRQRTSISSARLDLGRLPFKQNKILSKFPLKLVAPKVHLSPYKKKEHKQFICEKISKQSLLRKDFSYQSKAKTLFAFDERSFTVNENTCSTNALLLHRRLSPKGLRSSAKSNLLTNLTALSLPLSLPLPEGHGQGHGHYAERFVVASRFGLDKIKKIKTLLPKIKILNLAFGSSFLLLIMTTILQRQQPKTWSFNFLRRQTPGFYNFYQESSLECFDNITNKYLNRGTKYKNKKNVTLSPIKHINFYKDQLYIDFSTPWSQQLNQDFIAVFPKDSSLDKTKSFGSSTPVFRPIQHHRFINNQHDTLNQQHSSKANKKRILSLAMLPPYKPSVCTATKGLSFTLVKPFKLKLIDQSNYKKGNSCFTKTFGLQLQTEGDAPFYKPSVCTTTQEDLQTKGPAPLAFGLMFFSTKSIKNKSIRNRWIVPTLYKMHARIPDSSLVANPNKTTSLNRPVKASRFAFLSRKGLSFALAKPIQFNLAKVKGLPSQEIKARAFNENDTIPSKMSGSVNTVFADNYKLKIERQKKSLKKRRQIERKNDNLKKFFYEYGFFSILIPEGVRAPLGLPNKALQFQEASSSARDNENSYLLDQEQPQKNDNCKSSLLSTKALKMGDASSVSFAMQIGNKPKVCKRLYLQGDSKAKTNLNSEALNGSFARPAEIVHRSFCNTVDMEEGLSSFDLELAAINFENLISIKNFSCCDQSSNKPVQPLCRLKVQEQIEKVSGSVLYSTRTLCNRLMSGYKKAEVNELELRANRGFASPRITFGEKKGNNKTYIKIPLFYPYNAIEFKPKTSTTQLALPIENTFMQIFLQTFGLQLQAKDLHGAHVMQTEDIADNAYAHTTANRRFARRFVRARAKCLQTGKKPKVCKHSRLGLYTFAHQTVQPVKEKVTYLSNTLNSYSCRQSALRGKGNPLKRPSDINQIRAFKKVPYKKLLLNEYQEVKPLFDKLNQEGRISPHKVAFNKPLFTDYNDYLTWHKDSPAVISISPSLEEDKAIDQSWKEHLERVAPKTTQIVEDASSPLAMHERASQAKTNFKDSDRSNEIMSSEEDRVSLELIQKLANKNLIAKDSDPENNSNTDLSLDEDKFLNEEDKKREITKWEWLHNVRDSEFSIEKRKDLQKLAYQNKEALLTQRLKPRAGIIQNFLVSDRKSSFFGITNIFPKRLVAEDQKQINNQILQEDYNRRSVEVFESDKKPFFKFDYLSPFKIEKIFSLPYKPDANRSAFAVRFATEGVKGCVPVISNSKKSKTGGSLRTSNNNEYITYVWRQGKDAQVTKGNPLCGFKVQGVLPSKLRIMPRFTETVTSNELKSQQKNKETASSLQLQTDTFGEQPVTDVIKNFENHDVFSAGKIVAANNHPVYRPSRRLRLRVTESSKSTSTPQSRVDALNLYQSHRWWQKRRLAASLLGAPSKRYMVLPEISKEDWKKIIEWQLKTYFLEEEKRLQSLLSEKMGKADLFSYKSTICKAMTLENDPKAQSERKNQLLLSKEKKFQETLRDFKIKKIAIYLPWITLKKSLKKPFEWPLTRLTYPSISANPPAFAQYPISDASVWSKPGTSSGMHRQVGKIGQGSHAIQIKNDTFDEQTMQLVKESKTMESFVEAPPKEASVKNLIWNKKPDSLLVSAISPQFQSSSLSSDPCCLQPQKFVDRAQVVSEHSTFTKGYHSTQNKQAKTTVYNPFIFEMATKESHLVIHQLLLAIALKQIFYKLYYLFGKIILAKVKNSSLEIALLQFAPRFFNRENKVSTVYKLKKRLKDIVGSEDSISSLSEIVWYLRNACRGRMVPRGVVLLESNDSESAEFLKAVGGEAQVPVIVQSLRALPFTQNHPQRRLEKILKFAEKQAPCILFLDDLDSIGKSRTLLCTSPTGTVSASKGMHVGANRSPLLNRNTFSVGNEKAKWKNDKNGLFFTKRNAHTVSSPKVSSSICTTADVQPSLKTGAFKSNRVLSLNQRLLPYGKSSSSICKLNSPGPVSLSESKTNIFKDGQTDVSETDKVLEQRRLDLMLRLLTVMDGISHLKGVLIVTTSKNPSSLDPALLRPGRFERFINLKLPSKKRRIELLKVHTSRIGHSSFMPWEYLGVETENMSGASIANAINHSAFRAIIHSTPHTLSTLEYGLARVNNGCIATAFNSDEFTKSKVFPLELKKKRNTCMLTQSCARDAHTPANRRFARKFVRAKCLQTEGLYTEGVIFDLQDFQSNSAVLNTCTLGGIGCKSNRLQTEGLFPICIRFVKREKTHNFGLRRAHALKSSQVSFYNAGQKIIENLFKPVKFSFHHQNLTVNACVKDIIKFNAGQAAESLYLNLLTSTATLKNNALHIDNSNCVFIKQPTFVFDNNIARLAVQLQTLTHASSTNPRVCQQSVANLSAYKPKVCFRFASGLQEDLQPVLPINLSCKEQLKATALIASTQGLQHSLCTVISKSQARKYFQFNQIQNLNSSLFKQNLTFQGFDKSKDHWFEVKTCETLQNLKLSTGRWYRLYLPKTEQDQSNREWLIPDKFFNQHISLLNLNALFCKIDRSRFLKSDGSPSSLKFKSDRSYSIINALRTLIKQKVKGSLNRTSGLQNICNAVQLQTEGLQEDSTRHAEKIKRVINCTELHPQNTAVLYDQCVKELPLALSCFYVAFQNLSEHRELLDLVADHLIRFKFLRSHEIMRISLFYAYENHS